MTNCWSPKGNEAGSNGSCVLTFSLSLSLCFCTRAELTDSFTKTVDPNTIKKIRSSIALGNRFIVQVSGKALDFII